MNKPRYFRLTTLDALPSIPDKAVVGARRGNDYVAVSYEMTEDCECDTCQDHFDKLVTCESDGESPVGSTSQVSTTK